jgi:hypothetical protein
MFYVLSRFNFYQLLQWLLDGYQDASTSCVTHGADSSGSGHPVSAAASKEEHRALPEVD